MGKLPSIKNLIIEDFPDQKSWIQKLIYPINAFMEMVFLNLNKGLTFNENMLAFTKEVPFIGGSSASFKNIMKVRPVGLWIIDARQADDYNAILSSALYADWTYNQNNEIVINNISGLTAGKKYIITFAVIGGQMPYIPQSEKEKEQQQQGLTKPVLSGGGGLVGTTGQASSKPTQSGSWTNLQNYLMANAGQGERMAGQVAGGIEKQAREQKQALGGLEQEYQRQSVKPSYDLSQAQQFKQALGGQYTGPKSLSDIEGYSGVVSGMKGVGEKAALGKTEAGRTQLLSEAYARPQYGAGQKRLDQLLVQGAPGAREKIGSVSGYEKLIEELTPAEQRAAQTYQERTQQAQKEKGKAQEEMGKRVKALSGGLQSKYQQLVQENAATENEIQRIRGMQETGIPASNYLTPTYGQASAERVATPEDVAQIRALADIAGGEQYFDPTLTNLYYNPGLAGTATRTQVGFNEAGYKGAVQQEQTRLAQEAAARAAAEQERLRQEEIRKQWLSANR